MTHPATLLPLVLLLAVTACARPVPIQAIHPVCLDQDVVRSVEATLTARDLYATLLPLTVSERSTPGSDATTCGAYVRQLAFDTPRRGPTPTAALIPVSYTVRPVTNGFVVEVAPPGLPRR